MKKYSSYFNKRYFPEPEDGEEEEPLSAETDEEPLEMASPTPVVAPRPINPPAEATSKMNAFAFSGFDDEPEEEAISAPIPTPPVVPTPIISTPVQTPVKPAFSIPEMPISAGDVETTVISESAVISGELSVSGNIKMLGKIKGNMTAKGNLEIAGKVIGNLSGNDVELSHCELKGDINASGFTFMDKESIMIGNLSSQDVTLDGKVKGDVTAVHKVYVRSNAVIVGNVRAAVIAIDEGAALQGQVIIASKDGGDEGLEIGDESEN